MSYLVDGNNLMGQRVGWHRDKAGARRRLLGDLSSFARAARVSLAVVFDGAPDAHFPDGARFMGVAVFYAARGSDADERIKRMVDESRERRTLVVVTSDRALADYVRRSGAQVVRSGEFQKRMDETATKAKASTRRCDDDTDAMSDEELKREMRYFGVAPEEDE